MIGSLNHRLIAQVAHRLIGVPAHPLTAWPMGEEALGARAGTWWREARCQRQELDFAEHGAKLEVFSYWDIAQWLRTENLYQIQIFSDSELSHAPN